MYNNILMIFLLIEIYSCQIYGNCSFGGDDLEKFLGNGTDRKEKCFSLSNSFENGECCLYQNRCINFTNQTDLTNPTNENADTLSDSIPSSFLRNTEENNEMECPTKIETNIYNNCGLVGIYMPEKNSQCIGISLVQGYCCFVKIKDSNDKSIKACLRAKQLNKDKSKAPDEIAKYVKDKDGVIESVECGQLNLKLYWILNFILSIIYLFP